MLNPFQKSKLKIKTPSFEKTEGKPSIIATYQHFFSGNILKHSHKTTMGLCPLHDENNPSFAMYEETDTYFCFSCKESGDSYKLIMKLENLDFKGALRYAEDNDLYE